jgi:hypothetical protein
MIGINVMHTFYIFKETCLQVLLVTWCHVIVCLATQSTWRHAWNQLEKVNLGWITGIVNIRFGLTLDISRLYKKRQTWPTTENWVYGNATHETIFFRSSLSELRVNIRRYYVSCMTVDDFSRAYNAVQSEMQFKQLLLWPKITVNKINYKRLKPLK